MLPEFNIDNSATGPWKEWARYVFAQLAERAAADATLEAKVAQHVRDLYSKISETEAWLETVTQAQRGEYTVAIANARSDIETHDRERLETLTTEVKALQKAYNASTSDTRVELTKLRLQAGLVGLLGGLVPVAIAVGIAYLSK